MDIAALIVSNVMPNRHNYKWQWFKEKTAKLWSKLNNAKILPENINCNGCKSKGIKTIFCTNLCFIRKCAIKNNVDNYKQCAKFNTCVDIRKFAKINNL